jgi:hypothetical protein
LNHRHYVCFESIPSITSHRPTPRRIPHNLIPANPNAPIFILSATDMRECTTFGVADESEGRRV